MTDEHTDVQQVGAAYAWRMVLRRFAALVAGEGAARLVGFVVVLLLARRLGPTGFGIVTLGLTLVGWFTYITDSGTEILNVREIARRPQRFRQIAEQVLGLRLALSALAVVLYVAGVMVFARSDLTRSTLVLFALVLPATALNLRWMVLGVGGSRAISAGLVLSRMVMLGAVLLFVGGLADLKRVPVFEAVAALVYAITILLLVAGGLRTLRPRADLGIWRRTLSQSAPLMVNGLARSAVVSFDILLIDLALGPRSVGIYAVASKPAFFFTAAVGLFSLAFLSAFSATATEAAGALQARARRSALASAVLVAAALSVGSLLIPVVFGERYDRAVPLLAVLAWRIPFSVLAGIYSSVLIARDRQVDLMKNSIATAIFVVVADTIAVLAVGLMGAAVVSVAAAALSFLLNWRSVRRRVPDLSRSPVGLAERSAGP
jgi:O-antigen/teichoic acid export membrane protein